MRLGPQIAPQVIFADPRVAPGFPADPGTVAKDLNSGLFYEKEGTSDTDWRLLSSPGGYVATLSLGEDVSYSSATVPRVVGQISFDPTIYSASPAIKFRSVASIGAAPVIGYVSLYNLSDLEGVATFGFTGTSASLSEAALTVGSGAGNIKSAAKIYEVRIATSAAALPTDTINLGSAQLQVIS